MTSDQPSSAKGEEKLAQSWSNRHLDLTLCLVIGLALLLRTYLLGELPNGFHQDEATTGYDAYSMLKTGHSQYGEFLPLFSKAFFDYNESLGRFLTIPAVGMLGLNEFSTRLPMALVGTATVPVIYALGSILFNRWVGLWAALFLTVSPWHLQFSRIAFSGVLLPWLFSQGLLFFLLSLRYPHHLILSALWFGLALYTYSPSRVFVPLFLVGLTIFFWRHLWTHRKITGIAVALLIIIFIVLFSFWISPEGMTRFRTAKVSFNLATIAQNYISYFNPDFLFFTGDSFPRHSPLGLGELHWLEVVTLPLGIWALRKEPKPTVFLLGLWFFLYPLPAALTAPGHALRVIVGIPLFCLLSALGLANLLTKVRMKPKHYWLSTLAVASICLTALWSGYFVNYPRESTYESWRYGMRETITYAEQYGGNCILVSNELHHLHIFVLFYTQYDPALYQRSPLNQTVTYQYGPGYTLGKYRVTPLDQIPPFSGKCLLILRHGEMPDLKSQNWQFKLVHTIKNPQGVPEIQFLELTHSESVPGTDSSASR